MDTCDSNTQSPGAEEQSLDGGLIVQLLQELSLLFYTVYVMFLNSICYSLPHHIFLDLDLGILQPAITPSIVIACLSLPPRTFFSGKALYNDGNMEDGLQ